MSSHPNRSKRPDAAGANPDPSEIRAAREACGMTQTAAAAVIYCTLRAWQDWEGGQRRMHPASWDLWRMRAGDPEAASDAFRSAVRAIDRKIRAAERRE